MLTRCYLPTSHKFHLYGGRGITVCARWRESYEAFRDDLGPRPSPSHTIDRIDPNGSYCPSNTRWATPKVQANNRRERSAGVWVGNVNRTAEEWMRLAGVHPNLAKSRMVLGWPLADAVSTPHGEPRRT
jgi:hypothetical protein